MRQTSNVHVITFQRANVVTMFEPILTRNIGVADSEKIATYLARGGYQALRRALREHTPAELIEMVRASGLRGRGGAGFPAGTQVGLHAA